MGWVSDAVYAAAVEAATLAPSMHNSQPWRFARCGDRIDVLVDPNRRLGVADASGRASRLGCGAAVFNLRLALAVRGAPAAVALLPDRADPCLLARLTPAQPRPPTVVEANLHDAIPRRHSNRAPFLAEPVAVTVRIDLIAAARAEGGWLDLLLGPVAAEVTAELVRAADEILNRDDRYRAELSSWTRPTGPATDGIPMATGGPSTSPQDLLRRRGHGGPEADGHPGVEGEPLLAVLGGPGDWPADEVQAGQALQRVLLTATDLGLAASMFSQPIEVAGVREQLRLALGRHAAPQMLLRVGYAVPAVPTPRRPVSEVMAA